MKKTIKKILSLTLAASFALSGCSRENKADGEVVTLTWYIPSVITGNDKVEVFNKVNEILEERYNLRLIIYGVDSDNFSQNLKVINAGKDVYDLAFTSNWCNNFLTNVSNGVFYGITEKELKEYAPMTYASMSEEVWSAAKVNGKFYAVPNWQAQTRASAIYVPEEFLEATNTDINSLTDFDAITEYLRKITQINPECNKIPAFWTQIMTYYNFVDIYEEQLPGAIDFTKEGKPVVVNQYETAEFENYVSLRRQWVEEGLSTNQYLPDSKAADKKIKQEPFTIHQYSPMGESTKTNTFGYQYKAKQISNSLMSPLGVTAAMTGISATSKHPIEALKMIEIMNTDSEVMNLIAYGIEGKNYERISSNQIKLIENSNYSGPSLFNLGSMANAYLMDNQIPGLIEETKKFNDGAIASPLMGFNADLTNIIIEVENCRTVINEYLMMFDQGLADEAKLQEFRDRLKLAGSDKIIQELQSQIDKWYETK